MRDLLFRAEPDLRLSDPAAVFCLSFYDSPFSIAKFVIKYEVRVFTYSASGAGMEHTVRCEPARTGTRMRTVVRSVGSGTVRACLHRYTYATA